MKISTKAVDYQLAVQGMTRAQLAEKAGLSRPNVSTVLTRGTCKPQTAGKIANALNVDVSEILED